MGLLGGLKKAASSAVGNLKNTVQDAGDAVSSTVQNIKKGAKNIGEKAGDVAKDAGEGALKGIDWVTDKHQKYTFPAMIAAAPFVGGAAAPMLGAATAGAALYSTYDALRDGKNVGTALKNNAGDIVQGFRDLKKGASA